VSTIRINPQHFLPARGRRAHFPDMIGKYPETLSAFT